MGGERPRCTIPTFRAGEREPSVEEQLEELFLMFNGRRAERMRFRRKLALIVSGLAVGSAAAWVVVATTYAVFKVLGG